MAIEQPNTPSTDVQTSDAAVQAPRSDEPKAESSEEKSPSWWQRITRKPSARRETEPDSGDGEEQDESSKALRLTQEELDRKIQAETDRREAKRAQEARIAARRELRDKDPWKYAEEERREEEAAQGTQHLTKFFEDIGSHHDRAVLDPLFLSLPAAEQNRIRSLDGAGVGLKGRELVVKESLKALEKHYKAEGAKEAEAKLRRNPAFRKQVLREGRSTSEEPDLLPATSGSAADQTVSALFRKHYNWG